MFKNILNVCKKLLNVFKDFLNVCKKTFGGVECVQKHFERMQNTFERVKKCFFDRIGTRFGWNGRHGRGKIGRGFEAFFAEADARFQKKNEFFFGMQTVKWALLSGPEKSAIRAVKKNAI